MPYTPDAIDVAGQIIRRRLVRAEHNNRKAVAIAAFERETVLPWFYQDFVGHEASVELRALLRGDKLPACVEARAAREFIRHVRARLRKRNTFPRLSVASVTGSKIAVLRMTLVAQRAEAEHDALNWVAAE